MTTRATRGPRWVLVVILHAACVGRTTHGPVPPPPPARTVTRTEPEVVGTPPAATVRVVLVDERDSGGRLRLGHYASGDGLVGFVLDRSSTPIKLRIDGRRDAEVTPLVALPSSSSVRTTTRLEDPLGRVIVEVDDHARVRYFPDGHGPEIAMHRDGDAEPLGAPAVAPLASPDDVARFDASLRARCEASVVFDVDFASLGTDEETRRNAHWAMARADAALARVCRDAIGKSAVRAKLKTIRIKSATQPKLDHHATTLIIEHPLSTSKGPTPHAIEESLTPWL